MKDVPRLIRVDLVGTTIALAAIAGAISLEEAEAATPCACTGCYRAMQSACINSHRRSGSWAATTILTNM